MDNELIHFGDFVKATKLDNGKVKVEGYLVSFSGKDQKDLDGDYFPSDCFYGPANGDGADILFHHGIPVKKGLENLSGHIFSSPVKTKKDEIGIWAEAVLDQSNAYEKAVAELVEAGKIKWSSGSTGRLVRKEKDGKITRWPIIEASLTHTPANPFTTQVATIKAFTGLTFDESEQPSAKGVFETTLAERQFATWELWNTFEKASKAIAIAAKMSDVTGVPVDVAAKVSEVINEFSARLSPVVISQIDNFLKSNRDEFWLKSFDLKGNAPAAMPFAERYEAALAAVQGVIEDAHEIQELRIKSGRTLSAINVEKLKALKTHVAAMMAGVDALLTSAEPKAEPEAKSVAPDVINSLLAEVEQSRLARLRACAA